MAIDITMDDGDDSGEELEPKTLQLIRDEYDDKLEYGPGLWRRPGTRPRSRGRSS